MDEWVNIEVAYARPECQVVLPVRVPVGTTVAEAVHSSGLLQQFPEIDLSINRVGVYGKVCKAERAVRTGDRVEVYRPLIGDPKEIRRQLAAEGKTMGKR